MRFKIAGAICKRSSNFNSTPVSWYTLLYRERKRKQRKEALRDGCEKLKQDVIEFAQQIGIDKIRFASADTFETLKND